MLEEGWMGFEVVNLEREELFHPDLRKGMSGWNKRNEEDRNGFWQVVLTVCTVKEYSLLAFGQCSCGTCPAETPYWAEMFSGRNLFLSPIACAQWISCALILIVHKCHKDKGELFGRE